MTAAAIKLEPGLLLDALETVTDLACEGALEPRLADGDDTLLFNAMRQEEALDIVEHLKGHHLAIEEVMTKSGIDAFVKDGALPEVDLTALDVLPGGRARNAVAIALDLACQEYEEPKEMEEWGGLSPSQQIALVAAVFIVAHAEIAEAVGPYEVAGRFVVNEGWTHFFEESGRDVERETRFVYDRLNETVTHAEVKRGRRWQAASRSEMEDLEDSLRDANENFVTPGTKEALEMFDENELPDWARPVAEPAADDAGLTM